jgi:hypothetical protein
LTELWNESSWIRFPQGDNVFLAGKPHRLTQPPFQWVQEREADHSMPSTSWPAQCAVLISLYCIFTCQNFVTISDPLQAYCMHHTYLIWADAWNGSKPHKRFRKKLIRATTLF